MRSAGQCEKPAPHAAGGSSRGSPDVETRVETLFITLRALRSLRSLRPLRAPTRVHARQCTHASRHDNIKYHDLA